MLWHSNKYLWLVAYSTMAFYENLLCSSFSSAAFCLPLSKCVRILTHLYPVTQRKVSTTAFMRWIIHVIQSSTDIISTCHDSTAWQPSCPLAVRLAKRVQQGCYNNKHVKCSSLISSLPVSPSVTAIPKGLLAALSPPYLIDSYFRLSLRYVITQYLTYSLWC